MKVFASLKNILSRYMNMNSNSSIHYKYIQMKDL